tara:strand:- start:1931 stop:2185 length:255 start_codon:yes stop_codon:yes gene_type:complete
MRIDILKIITKCGDFSGQEVVLNSSEKSGIITFTFEWNELEELHNIELNFSVWDIETFFPDTLDDVLIGKFKFEYESRFNNRFM